MRIIVYAINYAPEIISTGKYTTELCEELVLLGHEVDVITTFPYYPEWKIHKEYKGKILKKENINGVNVYKCNFYVPKNPTGIKRILHEFSFLLMSIFWAIRKMTSKYDVSLYVMPPFHLPLMNSFFRFMSDPKIWIHVQDLQVDAAEKLGILKNKLLLNLFKRTEKMLFKKSTIISTISPGMQKNIVQKGVDEHKIFTLRNWVDYDQLNIKNNIDFYKYFEIPQKNKVLLYSGNIGEKQGLDILPAVAQEISNENITILVIGDGAFKEKLKSLVEKNNLDNIRFFPLQPKNYLGDLLRFADLHLVLQKKSASDLVMPSKLTNILAVGGVSIITASENTTLYSLSKQYNFAYVCEPENTTELVNKIRHALDHPNTEIASNATKYAQDFLNKKKLILDAHHKLTSIVNNNSLM